MDLIKNIKQSGLIGKDDLLSALANCSTPAGIIAHLTAKGVITPWQADRLAEGQHNFCIGDKYVLLSEIAKGGTGVVFRAIETRGMRRDVAIKVLAPEHAQDPALVKRVYREIEIAASLLHPNIMTVIEAGHLDGVPYLVMEYERGTTLLDWSQRYRDLPIDWVCECARQVAHALRFIDREGIVHRDIKPSNILIRDDQAQTCPWVKVLDLGLARLGTAASELTKSGMVLGTLAYIAPERFDEGSPADIRSDLYSLGCTMFELLTGELPWPDTSVSHSISARINLPPPRMRKIRPEIPAELDYLVRMLLLADPSKRLSTPRDLIKALEPFAKRQGSEPQSPFRESNQVTPKRQWQTSMVAASMRATEISAMSNSSEQPTAPRRNA